ncbi:MAG: NEW3 domain-containing protein [Candidatus Aenigmatarchaeota archaeon]
MMMKGLKGLQEKLVSVSILVAVLLAALPVLAVDSHLVKFRVYDYGTDKDVYSAYMLVKDSGGSVIKGPVYGKKSWSWDISNGNDYKVVVYNNSYNLFEYTFDLTAGMSSNVTYDVGLEADKSAPKTAATASASDWTNQNVQITLSCSDPATNSNAFNEAGTGSGCDKTYYKIGNGNWDTYSSAFSVQAEGTSTVSYYSADNATNTEQTKTLTVKIDKTAPSTAISLSPANPDGKNGWYVSEVTVTLTCSDSLSGCDKTYYRVDGGIEKEYSAPFKISADGQHTIDYRSKDKVGNIENWHIQSGINIDMTNPQASNENANPASPAEYSQEGTYTFSMDWNDALSGVDTVKFIFNGKEYSPTAADSTYSYQMTDLAVGIYKYKWTATDKAGSKAETAEKTYTISKANPAAYMHLALEGSEGNATATYPATTNATGWHSFANAQDLTFKLLRDDVQVGTGSPATESMELAAGKYKYTYHTDGGANYTAGDITFYLAVNKGTPTGSVIFASNPIDYGTAAGVTCSASNGLGYTLYRNGTAVGQSDSTVLAAGSYNYTCVVDGNQNYTAATAEGTLVVNRIAPTIHLAINGNEADGSQDYKASGLNITGWIEKGEGAAKLYLDGTEVSNPYSSAGLAAGKYEVNYTYAQSENYTEFTVTRTLTINKIAPKLKLELNGIEGDVNVNYLDPLNITGSVIEGDSGATATLYRDGASVANPDTAALGGGNYKYEFNYTASENYTDASVSHTLIINKIGNPVWMLLNGNAADADLVYEDKLNVTAGAAAGTVSVFRNGTDVTSELGTDVVLAAGDYVYFVNATGNENYTDNATGMTFNVHVGKKATTMRLWLNGTEGNRTYAINDMANFTAALDVAGKVIVLNYCSGGQVAASPIEASVKLDEERDYEIKAYWDGDENYTGSSVTYWAKVPDTTAPTITVVSPTNTTYQTNTIWANATMDDDGGWMKVNVDGTNYSLTNDTGSWNRLMTLAIGVHTAKFYAADEAGNENASDVITFTIPCLSHIVNTTVDGTYYADSWLNINASSVITCSAVSHSVIRTSTIINSTVIRKDLTNMYIEESYVDPNYTIPSENSVIKGNSNIDTSSIRNSTVEDHSNVTYSEVVNSTVSASNVHWSDIWYSYILRSTVKYSWIENSNVTDSYVENSTVKNSNVINSTILFSWIENMTVINAYIDHDYMYNGTITYNGTNYTTPTNLTELYKNADNEAPMIGTITFSNSTPAPGDTVNVTITATDNVAVASVTFNGTAFTYVPNTYTTWVGAYAIPSADGTYSFDAVATDYAGNQGNRTVWIIVNNSSTPQVEIDANPPVVGTISPTAITIGSPQTLSAAVSDDTGVVSCQLYIDNVLIGSMSGTPVKSGTVAYLHNFTATGTYKAFASCTDKANRTTNGTAVDIVVSEPVIPPGWGGGPGTGLPFSIASGAMRISVPVKMAADAGKAVTFTVDVENTGKMTLTGVVISVSGVPDEWVTVTPDKNDIAPNRTATYTVVISVPSNEPTGRKDIVIKARSAENYAAEAGTSLEIINPNTACSCPAPSDWNDCVNGEQTRTNYLCDVTTGWICKEFEEKRACTVQGPGGITGAVLGFIGNPTSLGISIIVLIVAGYAIWSMRKGKAPKAKEKLGI